MPPGLHFLPHQREGIAFAVNRLRTHRGAMFGDVMGLGKTIEAIGTLRQSTEGRQMAAATLSVGVLYYWQFLRRPLKFACRFASTIITVANSEGNLKEAAVIGTSRIAKVRTVSASLWIAPVRDKGLENNYEF